MISKLISKMVIKTEIGIATYLQISEIDLRVEKTLYGQLIFNKC